MGEPDGVDSGHVDPHEAPPDRDRRDGGGGPGPVRADAGGQAGDLSHLVGEGSPLHMLKGDSELHASYLADVLGPTLRVIADQEWPEGWRATCSVPGYIDVEEDGRFIVLHQPRGSGAWYLGGELFHNLDSAVRTIERRKAAA